MQSFRTEIENQVVANDILELERKIHEFHSGKLDEEKFRSLRLARGVYGQRQEGVQMIRIKLPYGKVTSKQLLRICDVSDEYSTGRLHITTRQDIQIHYVDLNRFLSLLVMPIPDCHTCTIWVLLLSLKMESQVLK